jgi:hypothetical protein
MLYRLPITWQSRVIGKKDMSPDFTAEFVNNAISQTQWDCGNQALYDLCAKDPRHERDGVIL